jgi:hypothetical protein
LRKHDKTLYGIDVSAFSKETAAISNTSLQVKVHRLLRFHPSVVSRKRAVRILGKTGKSGDMSPLVVGMTGWQNMLAVSLRSLSKHGAHKTPFA